MSLYSEKITRYCFNTLGIFIFLSLNACATWLPVEPLAILTQCNNAERPKDSIVDGQEVGLWDPDQKLVLMLKIKKSSYDSVCTGVLLSKRIILTAAHCVAGVQPADVTAFFTVNSGCPVNQVRRTPREIQMMLLPQSFDGSPQSLSDLALLYLEDEAPEEQSILPLFKNNQKLTSDKLLLVGFGISDEQKKDSQVLRRVFKSYKNDIKIKERSLILDQSKKNGGFCRGDSGAPLLGEVYGEPHILGINSASIGITPQRECHLFSLIMDTVYFSDWILENQKKLERSNWFNRWWTGDKILSDEGLPKSQLI